jgi:hypothetical protein
MTIPTIDATDAPASGQVRVHCVASTIDATDAPASGQVRVHCVACRGDGTLAEGDRFSCACGLSRVWRSEGSVELLGPCVAWWLGPAEGTIGRRQVPPLL